METKLTIILLVLFCALLGSFGQLFFKLGSKDLVFDFFPLITNWKLIVGLALYGFATILFLVALKFGRLSILYPIIATSYIWVAILSHFVLGEPFRISQWSGVALIIAGVIFVVR